MVCKAQSAGYRTALAACPEIRMSGLTGGAVNCSIGPLHEMSYKEV
jgi:hypothetical protein